MTKEELQLKPYGRTDTESEERENGEEVSFTKAWLNRYEGGVNTRPYVPVPLEYYEEMQYLTNEEFGELIRIMMWYSISGEILPVKGVLCHYMTRVIDRQKRYYIEWAELASKRKKAGKKGAEVRWSKALYTPSNEVDGDEG